MRDSERVATGRIGTEVHVQALELALSPTFSRPTSGSRICADVCGPSSLALYLPRSVLVWASALGGVERVATTFITAVDIRF